MRLRNVRGSKEKLSELEYVVKEPEQHQGNWKDLFGNCQPIHIEIGMGKGQLLIQLAKNNPDINYIGIERYSSVLVRAVDKRKDLELPNLYFIVFDAAEINGIFQENEVSRIYLNFSDPWPKDRHSKRRLTSKEYFNRYDKILIPEGEVIFKTDNDLLFDFSLEQVDVAGWKLYNYTYDLHQSDYVEGNVMTEYEEKFSALGNPIHRLVAYRQK
ncbi:MAG: tRNA (guanosine(46)-N7)-methyltransferase TrmB [Clostridiales bacterium]|nr:tRNA (guanosine(46)-N7)-methyltransferase TrmB [Clostridiales bacterium]